MIGCLGAEFHLAQPFVCVFCRLRNGVPEKGRIHEMGAGTGGQKSAVPDQTKTSLVDLAVTAHGGFDGIPGFCESRWIQDHDIVELSLLVERGKKVKNVRAEILQAGTGFVGQPSSIIREKTVQLRVFRRLLVRRIRCG